MNKQKRMIYVYEENVPFYDELENKSQFLNDALQDARINNRVKNITESVTFDNNSTTPRPVKEPENDPDWHPDPRIRDTRRQVREMEARDAAARG